MVLVANQRKAPDNAVITLSLACEAQIPLCQLPCDVRDKSATTVQLETEPVAVAGAGLDYGTVCHQRLSRVTLCHGSGENLKHFSRQSYPSI